MACFLRPYEAQQLLKWAIMESISVDSSHEHQLTRTLHRGKLG